MITYCLRAAERLGGLGGPLHALVFLQAFFKLGLGLFVLAERRQGTTPPIMDFGHVGAVGILLDELPVRVRRFTVPVGQVVTSAQILQRLLALGSIDILLGQDLELLKGDLEILLQLGQ
jgi:hypothetical protein